MTRNKSYQRKAYNPSYSRQPDRVISHTTNMPRAIHKGITNPTLGQWLVSLLYLHQLIEGLLNHRANKEIMLERQDLNKIGPSSTPFLWHTQNYIPSWSNSVRWSQWTYLQCSPCTPNNTTKTPAVITIPVIEGTQRKIALHWSEGSTTSSRQEP